MSICVLFFIFDSHAVIEKVKVAACTDWHWHWSTGATVWTCDNLSQVSVEYFNSRLIGNCNFTRILTPHFEGSSLPILNGIDGYYHCKVNVVLPSDRT